MLKSTPKDSPFREMSRKIMSQAISGKRACQLQKGTYVRPSYGQSISKCVYLLLYGICPAEIEVCGYNSELDGMHLEIDSIAGVIRPEECREKCARYVSYVIIVS